MLVSKAGDSGLPMGDEVCCYSLLQGEKVRVLHGEEKVVVQMLDGHLMVDFGGQRWFPGNVDKPAQGRS